MENSRLVLKKCSTNWQNATQKVRNKTFFKAKTWESHFLGFLFNLFSIFYIFEISMIFLCFCIHLWPIPRRKIHKPHQLKNHCVLICNPARTCNSAKSKTRSRRPFETNWQGAFEITAAENVATAFSSWHRCCLKSDRIKRELHLKNEK